MTEKASAPPAEYYAPPPYPATTPAYPVPTQPYPAQPPSILTQAPSIPPPPPQPLPQVSHSTHHPPPVYLAAYTSFFGPLPVEVDCPYCHAHVVSHIDRVAGAMPWIIFGICCVLGFFLIFPWCICCVPFCVDSCQDVVHTCPACKRQLGRYNRM